MPPSGTRNRLSHTPRIAVVGGISETIVAGVERMPDVGESLNNRTLDYHSGGYGGNTAVAAYRASHIQPGAYDASPSTSASSASASSRSQAGGGSSYQQKVDIFMNGTVGDDHVGKELQQQLGDVGVDISGVNVEEGERTGKIIVLTEVNNSQSRTIVHPGANHFWLPQTPNGVDCLAGGHKPDLVIVHLEHPRDLIVKVLGQAGKRNVATLLNPTPPVTLDWKAYKHVTHLVLDKSEAALLSGVKVEQLTDEKGWQKAVDYFLELGVKNIVLTLGKEGVYYYSAANEPNEDFGKIEARPSATSLDSIGAK